MCDFWFGGGVSGLGVKGWQKASYDEKSAFFCVRCIWGCLFFFSKLGIFSVCGGVALMAETVAAS